MLAVPILLFSMMGVSYADAGTEVLSSRSRDERSRSPLQEAVRKGSQKEFEEALKNTPFEESANEVVFNALRHMYALHTEGKHAEADRYFAESLRS